MKAIIPVAGIGTRLLPHTQTIPKALLHVAGKPILAHIVDELVALGVSEVVLIVGHLAARIEEFAIIRYGGLRLHFVPQVEPLGVFRVEHWYDFGTLEALLQANRELLELEPPPIRSMPTAKVIAPSYVYPSSAVVKSTFGPCVSIAKMARVVSSVIRDSIIGPHALVEDSHLVASLIGEHAAVYRESGEVNIARVPEVS